MKEVLEKINNQLNLSINEMQDAMNQIMSGKVNDNDIESFLIGLNTKGISQEEITAAALVMKEKSLQIEEQDKALDVAENEKVLILKALKECDNNRTLAAERLGMSRRTLHRRLKQFGIT